MANRIYASRMLPLKLVEVNPAQVPQYLHKHMDDYLHALRLNQWQSGVYHQPFLKDDVVSLQLQNNMGQLQVMLVDCHNKPVPGFTFLMTQKQQNKYQPDTFIYESNSALTNVPEGIYWFKILAGSTVVKTLLSEPIKVSETFENTLLLEYRHRTYRQNIIFETGFSAAIRVHGLLQLKDTPTKDTLYEDQVLDMVMVHSEPFRLWELILFAVPDWKKDKMSRIVGCSDLKFDGKYFTKNDGADWEPAENIGNGALKGWKIELRESINRNSDIFTTDEDTNEELLILLNTDSKGFGDITEGSSSNIFVVSDVE